MLVKTGDFVFLRKKKYEVIIADEKYFVLGLVKGNRTLFENIKIYSNNPNVNALEDLKMLTI